MGKYANILVFYVLLGIILTGCGKDDSPSSTSTSNTPQQKVTFPTGTFAATDADGQWRLIFNSDSTFTSTLNGTPVAGKGRYVAGETQVVLSDNSSQCAGLGDGTYQWAFNTPVLILTVVSENCVKRRNTLASNTWRKQ